MNINAEELLQEVVAECMDHLADIEALLLALEEARYQPDEEMINGLFRAAHSIKGVTGFCGLTKIVQLSHSFENLLGAYRKGALQPNAEAIDVCLRTADFLRGMLKAAADSENYDISPYVADLEGLLAGGGGEGAAPSEKRTQVQDRSGQLRFEVSESLLDHQFLKGHHVYILHLDLIRDAQARGRTPVQLVAHLESLGDILATSFSPGNLKDTQPDDPPSSIPFGVLLSSLVEPEMLGEALDLGQECLEELAPIKPLPGPSLTVQPELPVVGEGSAEAPAEVPDEGGEEAKVQLDILEQSALDALTASQAPAPEPEAAAAPAAPTEPPPAAPASPPGGASEQWLRVHVGLLDSLMNLAGELVLARNQLLQTTEHLRAAELAPVSQRIDLVTSQLQASIMQTRMQPLDKVFGKFPRLVRDLARKLDKQVELSLEGGEVELDKAIIENLGDPLVHLVRNAVDHGIEPPAEREAAGKPPTGSLRVSAVHEAGRVNIEIKDDGRGIDPERIKKQAVNAGMITQATAAGLSDQEALDLIFRAGFSTADRISDVSGRGVGMDVVRAALERLGGMVDLHSRVGGGTALRIQLPLTMAIIPCLVVTVGRERYAIPQHNMVELVRVRISEVGERLERVGGAEVLRLRDSLVPVVRLSELLQVPGYFRDPATGELRKDRRRNVADRRSGEDAEQMALEQGWLERRSGSERRGRGAFNIAILTAGEMEYGLVVDELQDTEEIVVKPLGRHLKDIPAFAGATIMGDGQVAPILDVVGLAEEAELFSRRDALRKAAEKVRQRLEEEATTESDHEKLMLFTYGSETLLAAPISLVTRMDKIDPAAIESHLGVESIQYGGRGLRLLRLENHLDLEPPPADQELFLIVFGTGAGEVGILAGALVDERRVAFDLDLATHSRPGIMGSLIIDGRTVLVLDVFGLIDRELHDRPREAGPPAGGRLTVLLVEDSDVYRSQLAAYLEGAGHRVVKARNGAEGLAVLDARPIDAVLTDVEMPLLDGLEMTRRIRANPRYQGIRVYALASQASEEEVARGRAAGVDGFLTKLDRGALLAALAGDAPAPGEEA